MSAGDNGVDLFVRALEELPTSELLRLRQAAGTPRGSDVELDDLFNTVWRKLRDSSRDVQRSREQCFLVAKLYPWNLRRPPAGGRPPRDLGAGFRAVRGASSGDAKNQERVERRFVTLLDSHGPALEAALLDTVKFLERAGVPVNWRQLLHDLADWERPNRSVQDRWYGSFRGVREAARKGE